VISKTDVSLTVALVNYARHVDKVLAHNSIQIEIIKKTDAAMLLADAPKKKVDCDPTPSQSPWVSYIPTQRPNSFIVYHDRCRRVEPILLEW
jgi:hypothetical protein